MSESGEHLLHRLLELYPQSGPVLKSFASGSFMIDIRIKNEPFVIEYVAGKGLGLSKLKSATYGWEGVEQSFENESDLEVVLARLLGST